MKLLHKLVKYFPDPKRLLHIIVLICCMCISIYQLMGSIHKLYHPPISTHSKFVINETLYYPAVTICRNPPYKLHILKIFNLGQFNSEIFHTSEWTNFPFSNYSLQNVWESATYSQWEVLKLFGLHGLPENVEVRKSYYLLYGQCFTLIPRVSSSKPWPDSGWSIMMKHNDISNSKDDLLFTNRIGTATNNKKPGFHIFIHEVREPWSENNLQTNFIMQYLYLEVGEEVETIISADEYGRLRTERQKCETDLDYSQYQCIEFKRWLNLSKDVGCTGPWIRGTGLPHCNSVEQVQNLITKYLLFDKKDYDSGCPSACNMTAYKLFVAKRSPLIKPFSQLYVYYTSKMVLVMEERPGYDLNAFLSDLGGSLGFFLGLSVIGTIGIIENFLRTIFCYAKPVIVTEIKKTMPVFEKY